MAVNTVTAALVVVCFAAPVVWVSASSSTRRDAGFDVIIVNASRQMKGSRYSEMTVTAHFTAASPPETAWFYSDRNGNEVILAEHSMEFAGGQGRATATLPYLQRVNLRIGHFDSHFLELSFAPNILRPEHNITQVLGTSGSVLSPDYDIAYTAAGESFDVTTTVPRHIAPGYSFFTVYGRTSSPKVKTCYVDQLTDKIVSEVDYLDDSPDMSAFFNVEEEPGETDVTVKMTFDTSDVDISGYFRIVTKYRIDDEDPPFLVSGIEETIFISVHDATTPGPFPAGYGAIRTYERKKCMPGSYNWCLIYCFGYSNQIDHVAIIRHQDGAELDAHVTYRNSHHVRFSVRLDTSESFAGSYSCRMELPGGVVVEENVAVVEVEDLYKY